MRAGGRALVLSGGSLSAGFLRQFWEECPADLVICADRGLLAAHEAGVPMDYLVGDFDSADPDILRLYRKEGGAGGMAPRIREYSPVKDATDTEIALSLALEEGAGEIWLLGAIGTRMDHTLANIQLLRLPLERGARACILDERNKIYLIRGSARLRKEGLHGPFISFLPFGGDARGVTLRGFKYDVTERDFAGGESLGVSNELVSETGWVSVREGILAAFETSD